MYRHELVGILRCTAPRANYTAEVARGTGRWLIAPPTILCDIRAASVPFESRWEKTDIGYISLHAFSLPAAT